MGFQSMEQSVARLLEGNQVSLPGIFEVKELNDSMLDHIWFLYILVLINYESYNDCDPLNCSNWSNFMDTYRIKIMICCISIFYWYPTIWLFALSFDLSFAICYAQDFLTIWKKCWHLFLWCLLAAFSSLKYCKS